MTFDRTSYHQFIKLLHEHPEWRAEARQLVLSEEILTLSQLMRTCPRPSKNWSKPSGAAKNA